MACTKLQLILTLGVSELISSSDDRKNKAPCRKVLIGDDAQDRDFPPIEKHKSKSAKIRATMCRADIRRVAEWTRGGTDGAVPSGQFAVLLVAKIIAEQVLVPDSVRGAGFFELESLILQFPPREFL
jgi:hypothetical protein